MHRRRALSRHRPVGTTSQIVFELFEMIGKAAIHVGASLAVMGLTMTVRADTCDPSWVVWAAIREPTQVVGFKVGSSVRPGKGCRLPTALACAIRSGQYVVADGSTSLVVPPFGILRVGFARLRSGRVGFGS